MALVHLEETSNVVIWGENAGGFLNTVRPRATALRTACEADFAALAGLFQASNRFGDAGNKIKVVLDPTKGLFGGDSIADNDGFHGNGDSTITIATYPPPFQHLSSGAPVDDAIASAFVAELAEVLLSMRSQDGKPSLNPGANDGEGFSRVMMAWRHPHGYDELLGRTMHFDRGPWFPVSHWMNETGPEVRYDWLAPAADDTQPEANGCAIAFLYFLHHQLGYPWASIVDKMGANLRETFTALTGRQDGMGELRQVLDRYFPVGVDVDWPYEDPFPLGDPKRRIVQFDEPTEYTSTDPVFATDVLDDNWADVSPFPLCPKGHYHYTLKLTHAKGVVSASVDGFAQPEFIWEILNPIRWAKGTAIDVSGWDDDPHSPSFRTAHTGIVELSGSQAFSGRSWESLPSSTFTIDVADNPPAVPGHFHVDVGLTVRKANAPAEQVHSGVWPGIDLEQLDWDDNFKRDRQKCADWWRLEEIKHEKFRNINLLLTLPDPPETLERALAIVGIAEDEVARLQESAPDLAARAAEALAAMKQVRARG